MNMAKRVYCTVLSLPYRCRPDDSWFTLYHTLLLLGSVGTACDHIGDDGECHECESNPSEIYRQLPILWT
jgi:hypothetical protein